MRKAQRRGNVSEKEWKEIFNDRICHNITTGLSFLSTG